MTRESSGTTCSTLPRGVSRHAPHRFDNTDFLPLTNVPDAVRVRSCLTFEFVVN